MRRRPFRGFQTLQERMVANRLHCPLCDKVLINPDKLEFQQLCTSCYIKEWRAMARWVEL